MCCLVISYDFSENKTLVVLIFAVTKHDANNALSSNSSSLEVNEPEENSPVLQVALIVLTTDDSSLPVLTFRMWFLGTISCILLSFQNQFFSYRTEPLIITSISAQIAVVPLGQLMAAKLTGRVFFRGQRWEFTLNPGPFNVKEHVLITIFANAGSGLVYAIHLLTAIKVFYKKNISFFLSAIVVFSTQVILVKVFLRKTVF
ncbi:hypothetical protein M9H77_24353 [Catharanthus roseus]|uniref:Uncharacterized protein n=1 Tax=Catharanthus roseus TaxID=4058 RepID=A0ACC0AXL9_CATRO|nr:hypothetical protein M9H77_24353 [Catharanthus roseus]